MHVRHAGRLDVHAKRARHAEIALPRSCSPVPGVLAASRRQSEAISLLCPLRPPAPPPGFAMYMPEVPWRRSVTADASCRCRCNMWSGRTPSVATDQVRCPSDWTCRAPEATLRLVQTKGYTQPDDRRVSLGSEHGWERRDQRACAGSPAAPFEHCSVLDLSWSALNVYLRSGLTCRELSTGGAACRSRGGGGTAARRRGRPHVHCQRGHRSHWCRCPHTQPVTPCLCTAHWLLMPQTSAQLHCTVSAMSAPHLSPVAQHMTSGMRTTQPCTLPTSCFLAPARRLRQVPDVPAGIRGPGVGR